MKRLSVRLSVIGTVLVLGGAAIAYSVITNGSEKAGEEESSDVALSGDDDGKLSPIGAGERSSGASPATIPTPPTKMFGEDGDVRQVAHESTTRETETTPSLAIPPDPTGSGSGYPLTRPGNGVSDDIPDAVGDGTPGRSPAWPAEATALADPNNPANADSGAGSSSFPLGGSGTPPADPSSDYPSDSAGGSMPPAPIGAYGAPIIDAGAPNDPRQIDTAGSNRALLQADPTLDSAAMPGPPSAPTGAGLAAGAAIGAAGAVLTGLSDTQDDPTEGQSPDAGGYSTQDSAYPTKPPLAPISTNPPDVPSASPVGRYATEGYAADGGNNYPSAAYPSTTGPPPSSAMPASASAGVSAQSTSNVPGDRKLEGQQAPSIVIEKSAPQEIQVNRKATFKVRVRNNGNAPAHNVVVVDRVPNGTQFIDATPLVTPTVDGTVVWRIEAIKPGEEVVLSMNLLPQVAGEIGSVAQATFQALASVRTICTKPELKLDVAMTEQVLVGQPATIEITITNTGNGAAEKVIIEEDVPEGFTHTAGRELKHVIGTLKPQESRRLTLVLGSAKPGSYQNRMTVRAEGDLFAEDIRPVQVTSPQLQVGLQGPSLRYLDRKATYTVQLANPGTASARNVELVTHLPEGMKYVTSDNHGQYDTQSHAVFWSLEELPSGKQGDVHVTILPTEPGSHKIMTEVRADLGLKEVCEHEVLVEGLAELSFVVSDVADPIEVGSETTYEIKVHNRGSKADSNIQLVAELPAGITPTSGDGPTQGTVQGQTVVFGPLTRLGPDEEAVFKIHARGEATGDHVIRAQLRSAELRVPVTKEEITRVYTDN